MMRGGKFKDRFVVTQVADKISASWVTSTNSYLLTGIVNGNSVYFKIVNTELDHPECEWVDHVVGIIKGNQIKGYFTNAATCGTCRRHGKVKVKIAK